MPKYINQKDTFLKCKEEGRFLVVEEVDNDKINSTVRIAEGDIESAKILKKNINKQSNNWNSVYKLYYDALHELVESFLRYDKIKTTNHQSLFVYLCEKYPKLGFDWEFFEKVRTKRNGINYYGNSIDFEDWNEVEFQFNLYLKKLNEEINKRLD